MAVGKRHPGYASDIMPTGDGWTDAWSSVVLPALFVPRHGRALIRPSPAPQACEAAQLTAGTADAGSAGSEPGHVEQRPSVFVPDVVLTPSTPLPTVAQQAAATTQPSVPSSPAEPQLDPYSYGLTRVYGSNVTAAWRYATGAGVTVGVVDDGFDPATTATFGAFSTTLSRSFAGGSATAIGEPSGGYHGTSTAGEIGATGVDGTPEGLAPDATLVGVKVNFSSAAIAPFAQAEQYAAAVSGVVNNSWGYTGYGIGEPDNPAFAAWYAVIQEAVQDGRGGLGTVIVFAAGNDRVDANNLAVDPMAADFRVIAVAATDADGVVAAYSTAGAALLVAAVGDNVTVADTGGSGSQTESGTSYAAPAVSAIVAMMLEVNPGLGWRDVQEILADSAYQPPPSLAGFVTNGDRDWNGGGMLFSDDLGFGVVDANVAVNLARAWTQQSTGANMATVTATCHATVTVGIGASVTSAVAVTAAVRVQHVEVTITDSDLPVADTRLVLISPDGTQSVLLDQAGLVNGQDLSGGADVSGDVITSNAFWGEDAAGTWTLAVTDIAGTLVGTIGGWSLTVTGDNAASVATPLVYTPEFPTLAAANSNRTEVMPAGATTIDLIALPERTSINLNGGAGLIDGVPVTVAAGLQSANADGSSGPVTLTGLAAGGSQLTGGDDTTTLIGSGGDTMTAGLGSTVIDTGAGGSRITLSDAGASIVTLASGGGDTIWAGLATVTITDTGGADQIISQGATLTFLNGSGASTLSAGSGTVLVQAGAGGGTYYAGTAGGSHLTAGTGPVTFYGAAAGDVLTAGAGADTLIAGPGAETLVGGSGPVTMTAGSGRTTFVPGTGNASIIDGGASDVIEIRDGQAGGLDTISGFRLGIDTLDLIGFALFAGPNAVSTATADGHGGLMLRFADDTRIDLLGVSHIPQSPFAQSTGNWLAPSSILA
jgi:subtilisin-like proprotein convertase family protein